MKALDNPFVISGYEGASMIFSSIIGFNEFINRMCKN